jgi:hypothetical protein
MNAVRTSSPSGNRTLSSAKVAKQDEFYTQLGDIENELKHYREHLRGKVILCNCDDPFESNFFKYFALNFNTLGLKKLICTSYSGSPIVGGQLPLMVMEGLKPYGKKEPYLVEINEVPDQNKDGAIDLLDVRHLLEHDANTSKPLKQGGDFRSPECVEILKQADIVVTNPPFSLFREFLAQLVGHERRFVIIGQMNQVHYKEIFNLIKENKVWLGYTHPVAFVVPDHYEMRSVRSWRDENGTNWRSLGNACWFTNMDLPKIHEVLPLHRKYSEDEYPEYDNYGAIEVGKVSDIPVDFDGPMGVPDTFLNKFNPQQFELLGIPFGNLGKDLGVSRNYRGRTDIAITKNGKSRCPYSRIIIKRKPGVSLPTAPAQRGTD